MGEADRCSGSDWAKMLPGTPNTPKPLQEVSRDAIEVNPVLS